MCILAAGAVSRDWLGFWVPETPTWEKKPIILVLETDFCFPNPSLYYNCIYLGRPTPHRSLPSSGGSMSSVSSNEGNVGTRRPPTSLSVLSASSLAEVSKNIRNRVHSSSTDGGLSPPPRVVSIEDSSGLKIMTELVGPTHPTSSNNDAINSDEKPPSQQQLTSKYVPLRPIKNKRK